MNRIEPARSSSAAVLVEQVELADDQGGQRGAAREPEADRTAGE